jgi:hypothetical protein
MIRSLRNTLLVATLIVVALPAAAQITPPNIRKPIDAAKKAAATTSAQIQNAQKVGNDTKSGTLPAEAMQSGAKNVPTTQREAAAMQAAAQKKALEDKAAAIDSASRRGSASESGGKGAVFVYREEYSYADEGRRDPFVSLMTTGELKPLLGDLALIGVLFDEAQPSRSLAVLVDGSSNETYRVKAGGTLGRMKVIKVGQRDITFSLDEFGFSRQETLPLDMSSRKTGAAPGGRPQ